MLVVSVSWAQGQSPIRVDVDHGVLELCLVGDNVLHVHFLPEGKATPPTLVMAPDAPGASCVGAVQHHGRRTVLSGSAVRVTLDPAAQTLELSASGRHEPLLIEPRLRSLRSGAVTLRFAKGSALYGIGGCNIYQHPSAGLLRRGIQVAKAGEQGNAGAPLVWSTAGFGVLVDSKGATFDLHSARLRVAKLSRPDPDFYLIAGAPEAILAAVADLSGHAPLFPKWSLGFINSQWEIDEAQLLDIVRGAIARGTYRSMPSRSTSTGRPGVRITTASSAGTRGSFPTVRAASSITSSPAWAST